MNVKTILLIILIAAVGYTIWLSFFSSYGFEPNITSVDPIEKSKVFTPSDLGYDEEITADSYRVISGKLERMERPADDIAYDYKLIFETPITGEEDISGLGQPLESAPIIIRENISDEYYETTKSSLERFIGQNIQIEGLLMWGYAETKHIEPINIIAE